MGERSDYFVVWSPLSTRTFCGLWILANCLTSLVPKIGRDHKIHKMGGSESLVVMEMGPI